MPRFLFVHGTSVREEAYNVTALKIEKRLKKMGHSLIPCIWGDKFGIPAKGWGASIPGFLDEKESPVDPERALWILLFQDPWFRIRELRPEAETWSPHGGDPGEPIWQALLSLKETPAFTADLEDTGLTPYWAQTLDRIRQDESVAAAVRAVPKTPAEVSVDIARAVIAELLTAAADAGAPMMMSARRDKLVDELAYSIGVEKGLFDKPLSFAFRSLRGPAMKIFMKYAADVLLYQSRGQGIRGVIESALEKQTEPVILLAHSLGGIACVDVLAANDHRSKVSHFITAGTQAPFLYEINALTSLSGVKVLPAHFPEKWLNIYDESDLLSFEAEPVFGNTRVADFANRSEQPPLAAHSAYWDSDAVWDRIGVFLK